MLRHAKTVVKPFKSLARLFVVAAALGFGSFGLFAAEPLFKPTNVLPADLVFATIAGEDFTVGELFGEDYADIDQQIYDSLYSLLNEEFNARVKKEDVPGLGQYRPSDREIEDFYKDRELASRGELADFRAEIRAFLINEHENEQLTQHFAAAIKSGTVNLNLPRPRQLVSFELSSSAYAGKKDAKTVLVEFSDFQCPFCKRLQPVMEDIIADYQATVGFYFRHFPLSIHPQAFSAAMAAECALEQQQFVSYKSLMFDNQYQLGEQSLLAYAAKIKAINQPKFSDCLMTNKYQALVQADLDQGLALGINGTPTLYIGRLNGKNFTGEMLVGVRSYNELATKLDEYLEKN